MSSASGPSGHRLDGISIRPAAEADLEACARIWRDGIDGYLRRMGFPPVPAENPGLRRLHAHTRSTDPARFLVAERRGGGANGADLVAFGSAIERGPVWFLSMLFVEPDGQARGVGRALLEALLPASLDGRVLATCTDSAQPISNGLYASIGIAPQMPLFNLVGRPIDPSALAPLPAGIRVERATDPAGWRTSAEVAELDRALLGFAHPEDHAFVQDEPRHLFGFRDGSGALLGYGYAGEIGRVGPIAVREPRLLAPVLGHLLTAVQPRGASSVWLPGAAADALRTGIQAGLRIEGFPTIACWSRPYADFTRYVPTSPGLI